MKHLMLYRTITTGMLVLFITAPVFAQLSVSTVRKIKDTGVVTIAYRETGDPFSYVVAEKPVGYSMDICLRVVDSLKTTLNMPNLKVAYVPVDSKTRFSAIMEGQADLECGTTTNNLERQRKVAFSVTTFTAGTRLLSKKTSGIRMLLNLKNKRVVVTNGSSNQEQIVDFNNRFRYNMTIIPVQTEADAMREVQEGRADAFATDDVLLATLAANSSNPKEWLLSVQAISIEPYGMMMRKGDPAFKRAVDDAIIGLFRSGEIRKIYEKWFVAPIPPKGVALNMPMSDVLEKVVKRPTDSGNPAYYH